MKYILSRYNHDIEWLKEYTDDFVLYDRSEKPVKGSIRVPNIGSDIYDKLTYIIDNYDNLPDVAVYTKANLFKYITKEEFDQVKDNRTFTPLFTKHHKTYLPTCYYDHKGRYRELNNFWYLGSHPCKSQESMVGLLGLINNNCLYNEFAPGSNYILPKENILQHTKVFYMKLRSYLDWSVYPGEAQILERNLIHIWQ
jgi:hypothetical protein